MFSTQSRPANSQPMRAWLAEQIEQWPSERVKLYAYSPRPHTEADRGKIDVPVLTWGWTMPVLVDEEGRSIAGEARLAVAVTLKLSTTPVIVARGWTEDKTHAYRISDNQMVARAS